MLSTVYYLQFHFFMTNNRDNLPVDSEQPSTHGKRILEIYATSVLGCYQPNKAIKDIICFILIFESYTE